MLDNFIITPYVGGRPNTAEFKIKIEKELNNYYLRLTLISDNSYITRKVNNFVGEYHYDEYKENITKLSYRLNSDSSNNDILLNSNWFGTVILEILTYIFKDLKIGKYQTSNDKIVKGIVISKDELKKVTSDYQAVLEYKDENKFKTITVKEVKKIKEIKIS